MCSCIYLSFFVKSFYRSCLQHFELKKNSIKEVKEIKINLDFIFNNFLVHRTDLQLVL